MLRVIVYPYSMKSQSAKALANALGAMRVYPDGKYTPREQDVVINYGASTEPDWWYKLMALNEVRILNWPYNVGLATDKRRTFHELSSRGVRTVPYTFDSHEAQGWLQEGKVVCERLKVAGHSADGLHIHTEPGALLTGKLFTEYVKKKAEYRVHVAFGQVIDVTQKKLRNGLKHQPDYRIRNHSGGWVYTRQGVNPPQDVYQEAVAAVVGLDLNFGAVDVGWNEYRQEAYVYEVNTTMHKNNLKY